jgi:hypothetical protein
LFLTLGGPRSVILEDEGETGEGDSGAELQSDVGAQSQSEFEFADRSHAANFEEMFTGLCPRFSMAGIRRKTVTYQENATRELLHLMLQFRIYYRAMLHLVQAMNKSQPMYPSIPQQ